jgi:hypothetical protein
LQNIEDLHMKYALGCFADFGRKGGIAIIADSKTIS